jgi:hypothetical protein
MKSEPNVRERACELNVHEYQDKQTMKKINPNSGTDLVKLIMTIAQTQTIKQLSYFLSNDH